MKRPVVSPETLSAQAMGIVEGHKRSIIPPLYPSTTFERNADLTYHEGRSYTRAGNPTYERAGELLALLEGGERAQLFSSGMAAAAALFQALEPGDHVLVPDGVYYGIRSWLERHGRPWGLEYSTYSEEDAGTLESGIVPGRTKIAWIETPSNPLWKITDIAAFSRIAHGHGATVVVDNTVPTPVLTRPIELGADIVMHSATKYLNGHGDVLAGALITNEENDLWNRVRSIAHDAGPLPGSFEAWLLLRGMRTLFLRMERICSSAERIAQFVHEHDLVSSVYYPGLRDFPGHEIAERQMKGGFGGMISIRLAGGFEAAVRVQANVKVFKRATSLGAAESMIEHRASYEGPDSDVPDDLLRLSIGIEKPDDLIHDLEQALEKPRTGATTDDSA